MRCGDDRQIQIANDGSLFSLCKDVVSVAFSVSDREVPQGWVVVVGYTV